jgi:uncharacterized repeat protein (TIGR01451 family)
VTAGGVATYTIVVRNIGPATAKGVNIGDVLPLGFSYAGGSASSSNALRTSVLQPNVGDTTLNWGWWHISPGGAVTITLAVNVGLGVGAGTYDNTATATSDNHPPIDDDGLVDQDADTPAGQDPEPDEDITVTPSVIGSASYTIQKTLNTPSPVRVGDTISYTIRVQNTGTFTLTSVPVSDTYSPKYLTYVSANPPSLDNNDDGQIDWSDITDTCGDLANGQTCDIIVYFTAWADTTLLPGSATLNTAGGNAAQADTGAGSIPVSNPPPASAPVQILAPTAVEMVNKAVNLVGDQVLVAWSTADESNVTSFYVWREDGSGAVLKLTEQPIVAQHAGQALGASYSYSDATANAGGYYRYVVEMVDVEGKSSYSEIGRIGGKLRLLLPVIQR